VASVLLPWPVASNRVRADSLGGTPATRYALTVGDQPAGDVLADALASLHRPGPLRPAPPRPVPGHVSAIPAATQDGLITVHDSIVADRLCRSIPITARRCAAPLRRRVAPQHSPARWYAG
jgi:hypothetical protein